MNSYNQKTAKSVTKSSGDLNNYECFDLDNGLTVMLIDDGSQKFTGNQMAYASLTVNVGTFNDPMHRQGLAHLVEHMVFRGSTKYPTSQAYDEHLTQHGGSCNAYTEYEKTTFHFDVQYTGLETALDIMGN